MNKVFEPSVRLVSITPNAMEMLKEIAGVCCQKGAVSDNVIKHILECGHWSVFEHCTATFEIHMTVAALLQITRHRHLSFTVQSSRHSTLEDVYMSGDLKTDRRIEKAHKMYKELLDMGYDHEMAMRVLPKAAMYDVYVTGNLRAWLEYLPKRLCARAMNEHRMIAARIAQILRKELPEIFCNIRPNCKTCHEKSCSLVGKSPLPL